MLRGVAVMGPVKFGVLNYHSHGFTSNVAHPHSSRIQGELSWLGTMQ